MSKSDITRRQVLVGGAALAAALPATAAVALPEFRSIETIVLEPRAPFIAELGADGLFTNYYQPFVPAQIVREALKMFEANLVWSPDARFVSLADN
jgi:hypothetical protein